MKYNIISINDDRIEYKKRIRERVHMEEISIPGVNGNVVDLSVELERRGLEIKGGWQPTKGEVGIWLSVFDNWKWCADNGEELVTFEDDAVPTEEFNSMLSLYMKDLPHNYHVLALWVPPNQTHDYLYDVRYDEDGRWEKIGNDRNVATSRFNYGAIRLARVYQGYGNVAMLYHPVGADKLLRHAQIYGITGPVDCWIFDRAHTNIVNGFAPKPMWTKAVDYDWEAQTLVHNTERH